MFHLAVVVAILVGWASGYFAAWMTFRPRR
jgi:uncharacterized protein YneF (UPF0154 family)